MSFLCLRYDQFSLQNKWMDLFPTIVSMARTLEVLSSGMMGGQSGSLQLVATSKHFPVDFSISYIRIPFEIFLSQIVSLQMYGELQVLSSLVPTREFYFLRYCQQIEQGSWAIVDVSYDFPRDNQFAPQNPSHRLPSGCLIQDMPNGYSKVFKSKT